MVSSQGYTTIVRGTSFARASSRSYLVDGGAALAAHVERVIFNRYDVAIVGSVPL